MRRYLQVNSATILLSLVILSGIIYWNSLSNPFQFDDEYYVSGNAYIRDLSNIEEVFLHPHILVSHGWPSGHYRPLVFISYALNYYLGGLNPWGYHLVNLSFHIGSAFLLFLILQSMSGCRDRPSGLSSEQGTGSLSPGFFAAFAAGLIFAVHPFNSEVVNYITARSSVMCSFLYLLSFYCWMRYRQAAGQATYYIASLLAFLLAMLTKEVAITLPAVLWLYDLYFVPRKGKIPYIKGPYIKGLTVYLPFVLAVTIPYLVLRLFYWGSLIPHFQRSLSVQLYSELPALIRYLRLFLLPLGLSIDHDTKIYETFFALPVIGSYILLTFILVLAIYLYYHKYPEWRIISFFIVWFFIVLIPTTVFPLNVLFQENRGYLAAISFAVPAGVLFGKVSRQLLGARFYAIVFGLLILIYSAGTISRNSVWKSDLSLWSDAIAKGANSYVAHTYLSKAYISREEYTKGEELLRKMLTLHPDNFFTHYNLSWVYYKTNRLDMALKEARAALKSFPSSDAACFRIGLISYAMGDAEMSVQYFKKALEFNPGNTEAHFNLGFIYEKSGQSDLATAHYHQVIDNRTAVRTLAEAAIQRLKKLEGRSIE